MKKRIIVITLCLWFFATSYTFTQDLPPPPPPKGGDSGRSVGGSAPIGGGTLMLIIFGSGYLVFKFKKENIKGK